MDCRCRGSRMPVQGRLWREKDPPSDTQTNSELDIADFQSGEYLPHASSPPRQHTLRPILPRTGCFLAALQLDVSTPRWMSRLTDLMHSIFSKQIWPMQHEDEVDSDGVVVTVVAAVVVRVVAVAKTKKKNGS